MNGPSVNDRVGDMANTGFCLGRGNRLDFAQRTADVESGLVAVLAGGRGSVVEVDATLSAVWIPLRGRLRLGSGDSGDSLAPGELRISAETRAQAVGRGSAVWLVLAGTRAAWHAALADLIEVPVSAPILLPARHVADRALRRRTLALARCVAARANHGTARDIAVDEVIDAVADLQNGLSDAIARCPGRTYAQRRQVFLRLQRVRNHLAANCQLEFDNNALARMASYSPWHFIRAFRAAYQETPHAYLVRQRLDRARHLLRASPLAVAEVALASGFENRCAFSRLFRQRFGVTAGAMRRQCRTPMAATAVRMDHAIPATRSAFHRQRREFTVF
jgi:AraC family transcriptional regulator